MIDIFKRWFFHSKEQDIDDSLNPWAGLASYEDPETAERKLKFCGRGDDSYDLARLIMGNIFVTLYGKSGIGKTSLLNAGVFPELREEQYSPVSIRLGIRDEDHPQSYQTMMVEAVERVVKRTETINVIDEQQDQQSIDYLWNYFARHRFYDKHGEPTTPVVVLDQFEEVFRGRRDETETLLRQLDYLNDKDHNLDSCEVDGQTYRFEQNYRFVVSIREDDLYRLEDSIDNCYLPALKRCRYRLRSLTEDDARDVILIPGEGLLNPEEQREIEQTIIDIARNKDDDSISTNLLSLVCSRIYLDYRKSGGGHISLALVETFVKGNPFEIFYNETTRRLSSREKKYIEDHLVDSAGRRNSIPENDLMLHIFQCHYLFEGNNRIFQRISNGSNAGIRVELIHDSFCESLLEHRQKRLQRQKIYKILIVVFILSMVFFPTILFLDKNIENEQNKKSNTQAKAELDSIKEQINHEKSKLDSMLIENNNIQRENDSISKIIERNQSEIKELAEKIKKLTAVAIKAEEDKKRAEDQNATSKFRLQLNGVQDGARIIKYTDYQRKKNQERNNNIKPGQTQEMPSNRSIEEQMNLPGETKAQERNEMKQ